MGILAIDAGSTGVTATVVTTDGRIAATGHHELASARPAAGQGRALRRRDLAGHPRGDPRGAAQGRRGRRSPRSGSPTGVTPSSCGTARRSARRAPRSRGRTAARSTSASGCARRATTQPSPGSAAGTSTPSSRPPAGVARRARAPHLGAGRGGALRRRHRRLLPRRAADPRHLARHRRLQRLAHPAPRPRDRRVVRRAVHASSGVPRDALPDVVPSWGEVAPCDDRSFLGLSLPIAGIAGDGPAALFGQACFEAGATACTYCRRRVVGPHHHRQPGRARDGSHGADRGVALPRRRRRRTPSRAPSVDDRSDRVDRRGGGLPWRAAVPESTLRVGGAAAADDAVCQLLADRLGRAVERPVVLDSRPRSAPPSWPGWGRASGAPPTTCARRGRWTGASSRRGPASG